MSAWQIPFILALAGQAVPGDAPIGHPATASVSRQLRGINAQEADALVSKLEDAQRRLTSGQFASFELVAGSIASYDKTKVSPRDAFLNIPFERVWEITRVPGDNKLWQLYRLAYAPNGLGQLYWDIEVVLGFDGDIQRVSMIYKPPAPF